MNLELYIAPRCKSRFQVHAGEPAGLVMATGKVLLTFMSLLAAEDLLRMIPEARGRINALCLKYSIHP